MICLLVAIDVSFSAKDEGVETRDDDRLAVKHTMDALLRQCKPADCSEAAAELVMQMAADASCSLPTLWPVCASSPEWTQN